MKIKFANKKVTKIPDDTSIITNLGEDTADEDIIDAIDYASMAKHDINSQSHAEGHIAKIIRKRIKYLRQVCDQCKDKVNKLNYIKIHIQEIHYLKMPSKEDTAYEEITNDVDTADDEILDDDRHSNVGKSRKQRNSAEHIGKSHKNVDISGGCGNSADKQRRSSRLLKRRSTVKKVSCSDIRQEETSVG